jgi:hypothetical protein
MVTTLTALRSGAVGGNARPGWSHHRVGHRLGQRMAARSQKVRARVFRRPTLGGDATDMVAFEVGLGAALIGGSLPVLLQPWTPAVSVPPSERRVTRYVSATSVMWIECRILNLVTPVPGDCV